MDIYTLYRNFWDFSFDNPEKVKPNHIAIFSFAIEHCNRLGWKKKFGYPTTMAMDAIGIKSYGTYIKSLNELVEWGFIIMIEKSKNQYSANIIALSNNDKAHSKALDKAFVKHASKQDESTHQSIDSIDKQVYKDNNTPIYINANNLAYQSELEFIEDWNVARKSILGVQSNMRKLCFHESENFKDLNKNFLKEDFKNGMRGLMKQKNGILPTMQLRPDHFLKDLNIEKYIDAHLNKKQLYTDNKKIDRL